MAVSTRFVKNDIYGMFKATLAFPVEGGTVLEMISVKIAKTSLYLRPEMIKTALRRQVTINTIDPDPAFVMIM